MPSYLLVEILLLSFVDHVVFTAVFTHSSQVNCTYLESKVPKPKLKYMLSGEVHVIWEEDSPAGVNYTAHICCTKQQSQKGFACLNTCPQFKALTTCNPGRSVKRQCNVSVSEYFEYAVYLNASHQGCQLRGETVKIWPSLSIAYPGPVLKFSVYSQGNGLIIEWKRRFQYVRLLYALNCRQVNRIRKEYRCCIRSFLPYGISVNYSQVCKSSETKGFKEITKGITCNISHECKTAEAYNMSSFSGVLMSDDTNWPNIPPSMLLEIEQRKQRN